MKYFTREWWLTGGEDETVLDLYQAYYNSISSKLPDELVKLDQEFTLHDSSLIGIETDLEAKSIQLSLAGWNQSFSTEIHYRLKFKDVSKFVQQYPKDNPEAELGDLGYWEYEIVNSAIEMRVLFTGGAEFSIVFEDFSFEHEQTA